MSKHPRPQNNERFPNLPDIFLNPHGGRHRKIASLVRISTSCILPVSLLSVPSLQTRRHFHDNGPLAGRIIKLVVIVQHGLWSTRRISVFGPIHRRRKNSHQLPRAPSLNLRVQEGDIKRRVPGGWRINLCNNVRRTGEASFL